MSLQYIIVAMIVTTALFVAVKKAVSIFSHSHNAPQCAGCPLADRCSKVHKTDSKPTKEQENCKKCPKTVAQSGN